MQFKCTIIGEMSHQPSCDLSVHQKITETVIEINI